MLALRKRLALFRRSQRALDLRSEPAELFRAEVARLHELERLSRRILALLKNAENLSVREQEILRILVGVLSIKFMGEVS